MLYILIAVLVLALVLLRRKRKQPSQFILNLKEHIDETSENKGRWL